MGIEAEMVEQLAEANHEIFCRTLKSNGYRYGPVTREHDRLHSSLKPYAELSENEKEQNRNSVRDIPRKLSAAGYTIVPIKTGTAAQEFSDSEIDMLSEIEHQRWVQTKIDAGWKHAPVTDKSHRLHQWMVPWCDLPEKEKEKDRIFIRAIPEILEKAGYTIEKP